MTFRICNLQINKMNFHLSPAICIITSSIQPKIRIDPLVSNIHHTIYSIIQLVRTAPCIKDSTNSSNWIQIEVQTEIYLAAHNNKTQLNIIATNFQGKRRPPHPRVPLRILRPEIAISQIIIERECCKFRQNELIVRVYKDCHSRTMTKKVPQTGLMGK